MDDRIFEVLLNWFMVSDPWPLTEKEHDMIEAFLDEESKKRGEDNWVCAYHRWSPVDPLTGKG